jgi:hypothetical protein
MNITCIEVVVEEFECPICPANVCITDKPDDKYECPPYFNYTGPLTPGYTYNYTINGGQVAAPSDGNWKLDWSALTQPTNDIPVVNSTICFNIMDGTGANIQHCCKELRYIYDPSESASITHTP